MEADFDPRPSEEYCVNCSLIKMGEMACYTDRCRRCGNYPPGRQPYDMRDGIHQYFYNFSIFFLSFF
jgi:hypothetical protein